MTKDYKIPVYEFTTEFPLNQKERRPLDDYLLQQNFSFRSCGIEILDGTEVVGVNTPWSTKVLVKKGSRLEETLYSFKEIGENIED